MSKPTHWIVIVTYPDGTRAQKIYFQRAAARGAAMIAKAQGATVQVIARGY